MSNEIEATIVGNLTNDPELRFTQGGVAVANFTIAQTPRVKNGDEWVDGETIFIRCTVWREVAENVAESLRKGERILAKGRMKVESYTPRDGGEAKQSLVFEIDELGHTLRWGTSQFTRGSGQGGQQQGRQQGSQQGSRGQRGPQAGNDPWASQQGQQRPQQGRSNPWANNEEPPF